MGKKKTRLPSLDGLRAMAIGLVLLGHSARTEGAPVALRQLVAVLPDAHFGVEVFFVISGFIITFLLANEERHQDRISLRGFYTRRARRILPALGVYLLAVLALQLFLKVEVDPLEWVTSLTFTRNFYGGHWLTGHLWSISVEEQFYLIWPFVFLWTQRDSASRAIVASVLIVTSPIVRALLVHSGHAGFANVSFPTNMDFLMSGAIVGALVSEERVAASVLASRPTLVRTFLMVGLVALLASERSIDNTFVRALGPTLRAPLIALLMISFIFVRSGLSYQILNLRPFMYLGTISYGVYLWQQLWLVTPGFYEGRLATLCTFPLNLVVTGVAAWCSYRFVELPLLARKDSGPTRLGSRLAGDEPTKLASEPIAVAAPAQDL